MRSTNSLYLVTLSKESENPFARENDVEAVKDKEEDEDANEKNDKNDKNKYEAKKLEIDIDSLMKRIVHIPVPAANYFSLSAPEEGQLDYLASGTNPENPTMLNKYDLKERKNKSLFATDAYSISADAKKMLVYIKGDRFVTNTGKSQREALWPCRQLK